MLPCAEAPARRSEAAADPPATPIAPAPAAPERATGRSATFVVVPEPGFGESGPPDLQAPWIATAGARAAEVRDAALREALTAAPPFVLASAATAACAVWPVAASTGGAIAIVVLLVLHGAWLAAVAAGLRRPRRHARGDAARRRFIGLSLAAMAGLAAAPWIWPAPAAAGFGALAALSMATALAGAVSAAPLPLVAFTAAALPLSAALATGRPEGFAGVLIAALLATWRLRGWRATRRQLALRDESIARLQSERDAAIRDDEEKSRFLAIASHDLRQPVHALGLFAATLEKRLIGSAEEPLARNMIRSIEGLDRSFNAMLDISRLDAGTIEPNIQTFPLRDVFRRLHMHFAGQAELSGLGLRFSPGGKTVTTDPQLLERILGNLVQNAIKYTEQGGVVVVARSTATHLNIEVWDTGVGIRDGDLPRVFDEFYQVGRSERARAQGLGIGLAIVKRLALLLGHPLTVSSRPGRGTMFRIGIRTGGPQAMQDAVVPADTLPMPLPQARTVLVIDDEEAIREGLALLLEEWGYRAVPAGSIAQAKRVLAALDGPPDLILSDLHLGDGPDGIAAINAVRAWCGLDVAAVLITGDTSHEEVRRADDSGHAVLFKPVQPRRLYNVVRGVLA